MEGIEEAQTIDEEAQTIDKNMAVDMYWRKDKLVSWIKKCARDSCLPKEEWSHSEAEESEERPQPSFFYCEDEWGNPCDAWGNPIYIGNVWGNVVLDGAATPQNSYSDCGSSLHSSDESGSHLSSDKCPEEQDNPDRPRKKARRE